MYEKQIDTIKKHLVVKDGTVFCHIPGRDQHL